jgi:tRNA dimethylallyltransferase
MIVDSLRDAFVLTGPTGSGKSALGIELAEGLNAEIISMDSMAIYKGMDIGTAKPRPEERRRARHHLIDVLDPWESGSVAWWLKEANRCAQEIRTNGRGVLFVGGTPLYLKALLLGLFDGPGENTEVRQQLTEEASTLGNERLFARLVAVDPVTAKRVHPNDQRRIIRALEVWQATGKPISSWQKEWKRQREDFGTEHGKGPRVLWLDLPRPQLYARIDERVRQMMAGGLVDEVRGLMALPRPLSREARQALGYKEVINHLEGKASLDETISRIQLRSRNFAKRQITWFRHMPECRPATRELTFLAWGLKMYV